MGHDSLHSFFKANFALMHIHKYSLTELENMLPWERMLYLDMLIEYNKEQEEKQKDAYTARQAQNRVGR